MGRPAVNELRRAYAGARVFLTGDTGFKGAWLSLWLHRLGAEVWGFSLPPEKGSLYEAARVGRLVRHVDGDLRDPGAVARAARRARPRFVFHLAAQALVRRSYRDPKETFDVNVGGSVNLLEAVRGLKGLRALVYCTSDKCYEDLGLARGYHEGDALGGSDPYSASKAAAEVVFASYRKVLLPASLGAASVRAGNVIGGGDRAEHRIVPDLARAYAARRPLVLRRPGDVRPWQHVLDPLHGYLLLGARLAAAPARHSGPWNFGPEARAARTVRELVGEFGRAWGAAAPVRLKPTREHETRFLRLDPAKARRRLGWSQRWGFQRAVDETARWYKAEAEGGDARSLCLAQIEAFEGGA